MEHGSRQKRKIGILAASTVLTIGAAGVVGLGSAYASSAGQPSAELLSPPGTSAVYASYGDGRGQRVWCNDVIESEGYEVRELSSWSEINDLDIQVEEGRLVKVCDDLTELFNFQPVEVDLDLLSPPDSSAVYASYGDGRGQRVWCNDVIESEGYEVRELSSWGEINDLDIQVSEGRLVKVCDDLVELMESSDPVDTAPSVPTPAPAPTAGPVDPAPPVDHVDPVDPAPVDPAPVDPAPVDPAPAPAPVPAPVDPAPVDPAPAPAPVPAPVDPAPAPAPTPSVPAPAPTPSVPAPGPVDSAPIANGVSERVTAINVQRDFRLVYNPISNSHEDRWVETTVAELDDGTVTRDLDNLYELGIEGSRLANPGDWGVITSNGSGDVTVSWGNSTTRTYEMTLSFEPASFGTVDACFVTKSSFVVEDGRDEGSLSGTVCFDPDGTFTSSRDGFTGTYAIDGFAIKLDFNDGAEVSVPFAVQMADGQIDSLLVGEGILINEVA